MDTNIKYLLDNNINIWNKDAYNYFLNYFKYTSGEVDFKTFIEDQKTGFTGSADLGRIYGAQWRNWTKSYLITPDSDKHKGLDQISNLIKGLKETPLSTEHIVTAWNPAELDDMALPPCHKGFQIMVYELTPLENIKNADKSKIPYKAPKYGFDLVWEQRSCDSFLGIPFNIASYALLAHIIAKIVDMVPGKIYGDLRNVHIYDNAIDAVKEQLSRDVNKYEKCELNIKEVEGFNIFNKDSDLDKLLNKNLGIKDFELINYKSYLRIPVEMLSRD